MQQPPESDEFGEKLKKRNRIVKLLPKTHKIVAESGRSLKTLWQRIVKRSEKLEEKK